MSREDVDDLAHIAECLKLGVDGARDRVERELEVGACIGPGHGLPAGLVVEQRQAAVRAAVDAVDAARERGGIDLHLEEPLDGEHVTHVAGRNLEVEVVGEHLAQVSPVLLLVGTRADLTLRPVLVGQLQQPVEGLRLAALGVVERLQDVVDDAAEDERVATRPREVEQAAVEELQRALLVGAERRRRGVEAAVRQHRVGVDGLRSLPPAGRATANPAERSFRFCDRDEPFAFG